MSDFDDYLSQGEAALKEGLFEAAATAFDRAKDVTDRLQENASQLAKVMNAYSNIYYLKGDFKQAEQQVKIALELIMSVPDRDFTLVSEYKTNLGLVYREQELYYLAEDCFKESLQLLETHYGPAHPELYPVLCDMAVLYLRQGMSAEALPLIERGRDIKIQEVGSPHEDLIPIYNLLGNIQLNLGHSAEAERYFWEELSVSEKLLGPEHPEAAKSLCELAKLYLQLKKWDLAEPLLDRALTIQETILGDQHPDFGITLFHQGNLYREQNHLEKAAACFRQSLAILQQDDSYQQLLPNVLADLGKIYLLQGDDMTAIPLFEQAFAIEEKLLGPENPGLTKELNTLAGIYLKNDIYDKAAEAFERLLLLNKKVFGQEHVELAETIHLLAILYFKLDQYALAETQFKTAIAILTQHYGAEDSRLVKPLRNLAVLYAVTQRQQDAQQLEAQAREIESKDIR